MQKNVVLKKRKTLKLSVKICLLILAVCLQLFSIFCVVLSLGYFTKKEQVLLYSYNIDSNLSYRVFLKDNDYLEEKSLGMNELYIADLVDYIDINYDYLFSFSKLTDLNSGYKITATIYGEYQTGDSESNNKVWSKEYEIIPTINEVVSNSNQVSYKPEIHLSLDKYQEEVVEFQKSLKLPLNTRLIVTFSSLADVKEYDLKKQTNIELSIPLNEQVFSITTNYDKHYNDSKFDENLNKVNNINYSLFTISIIMTFISFICLYKCITAVIKALHKSEYDRQLRRIRRDYDEIIVDVSTSIELDDYQVIEVKTFDELMDLENELHIPILFYEELPKTEAWFVILHQQLAYRYILYDKEKFELYYNNDES